MLAVAAGTGHVLVVPMQTVYCQPVAGSRFGKTAQPVVPVLPLAVTISPNGIEGCVPEPAQVPTTLIGTTDAV